MNWSQLAKRQAKEYKEYLNGYRQSLEQLNADRALLLGQHTISNAPANVRDKINRDHETWKAEWSMAGQRIKELRANHNQELTVFFEQSER